MTLTVKVERRSTKTEQTPFGARTVETVVTERVPLVVHKKWGMFTAAGNRRLKQIAEDAMKDVEANLRDMKAVRAALVKFLVRWYRMSYSKSYREAGDSAVRVAVGNFHDALAVASGHWDKFEVYDLWERNREAAYVKLERQRAKKTAAKNLTDPPGGPSKA